MDTIILVIGAIMNIFKKVYCRTFQTVFKLALPLLPYREPQILGGLVEIPQTVDNLNLKKPLIVTDGGIVKAGLLVRLEEVLRGAAIPYAVFDKTVPNPTTDNVDEALKIYRAEGCDFLIGLGGGSSMDCAKALGAKIAKPKKPLSKMKGILKVRKKIPTLIAIPTTAGTGSETTLAAVIVDSKTRHKYAINDFPLIPEYAVLDPAVTVSLPPQITATTGMDALTHAVEAYIGRSTTKKTRAEAIEAVRLIFNNIERAYADGSNLQARAGMLKGSYLAGCAFTKSYVGYVHAIAHSLGGEYNVPHGLANAVILPMLLEAYGKKIHKKLKNLAIAAGLADANTPKERAAADFIAAIKTLKVEFGIGDTFKELKSGDIDRLARYADKEANPLYPVPVLFSAKQLKKFYYQLEEK